MAPSTALKRNSRVTNPHLTCQNIVGSEEELDFILKTRGRIDREVGNDQKCLHGEKYE